MNAAILWKAFEEQVLEPNPKGFIQSSIFASKFTEIYDIYRDDAKFMEKVPVSYGKYKDEDNDAHPDKKLCDKMISRYTQYYLKLEKVLYSTVLPQIDKTIMECARDANGKPKRGITSGFVGFVFKKLPPDFVLQVSAPNDIRVEGYVIPRPEPQLESLSTSNREKFNKYHNQLNKEERSLFQRNFLEERQKIVDKEIKRQTAKWKQERNPNIDDDLVHLIMTLHENSPICESRPKPKLDALTSYEYDQFVGYMNRLPEETKRAFIRIFETERQVLIDAKLASKAAECEEREIRFDDDAMARLAKTLHIKSPLFGPAPEKTVTKKRKLDTETKAFRKQMDEENEIHTPEMQEAFLVAKYSKPNLSQLKTELDEKAKKSRNIPVKRTIKLPKLLVKKPIIIPKAIEGYLNEFFQ